MHSDTDTDAPIIELSMTQRFEIEKMNRIIDSTNDLDALKQVTKQIMHAWHLQKSATLWVMKTQSSSFPSINK